MTIHANLIPLQVMSPTSVISQESQRQAVQENCTKAKMKEKAVRKRRQLAKPTPTFQQDQKAYTFSHRAKRQKKTISDRPNFLAKRGYNNTKRLEKNLYSEFKMSSKREIQEKPLIILSSSAHYSRWKSYAMSGLRQQGCEWTVIGREPPKIESTRAKLIERGFTNS